MRMPFFVFAALLVVSCWQPGYDPDLIESERFADRLGTPEDSFTLTIEGDSSGNGYYLPPRDPYKYRLGFGIERREGTVGIVAVTTSPDGRPYAPSWGYGAYDRFGPSAYFVPTAMDPFSLVVWVNPREQVLRLTKLEFGGLSPSGSFPGGGAVPRAYVAGGTAVVSESLDRFHLAYVAGGTLNVDCFALAGAEPSFAALTYAAALPADALVFSEEAPAFVALSADGSDLYLSGTREDGTAATYVWRDYALAAPPVRLDGIDRKITGMLADGRLYAADEDGMRVYGPDGTGHFDLSYKKILYAGERWDAAGGRWISRFTRATTASADSGDGMEYRIEIWEHPTETLSRLAD